MTLISFSQETSKINVNMGDELIVTFQELEDGVKFEELIFEFDDDFLEIASIDKDSRKVIFKTKKIANSKKILVLNNNTILKIIDYTISAKFDSNNLNFTPKNEVLGTIILNQTEKISISSLIGNLPEIVETNIKPASSADVFYNNGIITLIGKAPSTESELQISVDGLLIKTYKFSVADEIVSIQTDPQIIIKQNEKKLINTLIKNIVSKSNSSLNKKEDLEARIKVGTNNTSIIEVSGDSIIGKKAGNTLLTFTDQLTQQKLHTVGIQVEPIPTTIVINPLFSTGRISYPNIKIQLKAEVLDAQNEQIFDSSQLVRWDSFPANSVLINKTGTSVEISAIQAVTNDTPIQIKACLVTDSTKCDEYNIIVTSAPNVVSFRPLKIRLDLMDERTARDLFGKVATKNYHIAKVRLFNIIQEDSSEYFGDSILVYSESLEVKVALSMREKGKDWQAFSEEDYELRFGGKFKKYLSKTNATCESVEQNGFFIPYRPLTFDMVANTHDRRDDSSTRNKILFGLNSISVGTSFITSIAIPGAGSDLPLGLDKFQNFLIPGFEKLVPSLREVQRQNLISMVMRPLEEVPFGSDITRVIFFPKSEIEGLLPELKIKVKDGNGNTSYKTFGRADVKISGISISDACAEVAVIKKARSTAP